MYSEKLHCWQGGEQEESLLLWCREPFNRENPEALFLLADHLLVDADKGKENAEAVYMMEKAAGLDYPQAALAMGQMFHHGWAVHRSWKQAKRWYEKAAKLGSGEAAALLEKLERKRKRRLALWAGAAVTAAAVLLAVCVGLPAALRAARGPQGVLVHEDTELVEPATLEEFTQALNGLVEQYDDELVVQGLRSTDRLLLKFEGEGIDLSAFPAATVINDGDNYLVIQFASEEEAQRCLEALKARDAVLFVSMDEYTPRIDAAGKDPLTVPPLTADNAPRYESDYSGMSYLSWGATYLGMDRLAGWLMTQDTQPVVVAVLDTGVEPQSATADRILEGIDMTGADLRGWQDLDGHGTHVAGTILDCTQGLDVKILPVQVFVPEGGALDSYIIQGLKFAIQNGADVINMSLGGPCPETEPGEEFCGDLADFYIQEAVDRGIVVVVAAGNETADTAGVCPAHLGNAIVVAACGPHDGLANFSNYGESVDVAAPGLDVLSYFNHQEVAYLDGTSMASPHVAALAAMLKTYLPDRTPAQLEKYICQYCREVGDEEYYGAGIPWAGWFAGE